MPARTINPFRVACFWLGIQAVWGAVLGISLQARTLEFAPHDALVVYGRLATAGAFVAGVVQILAGIWSDARRGHGSRRIEFYVIGALVGAVAIVFFYDARSIAALAVAFIALQGGLNIAIGPYQAIIPDFVPRGRFGIASSWMAALQSAGNALGALVASLIGDARVIGATLGALVLAGCAVTSTHVRAAVPQPIDKHSAAPVGRAFVDLFISRAFVYIGFYTLLGYLLFYVKGVLGAPSIAAARWQTGILILAFTLIGAVGAAFAARPSDRFDRRLVANVGGAVVIVALVIFITVDSMAGATVATVVAGIGWGVFLVADWAIACRVLPPGALATTMGIWNLAVIVPQIIAPALTTFVLQRMPVLSNSQAPRAAFGLAVGEILLGIAWLWRLSSCTIGE